MRQARSQAEPEGECSGSRVIYRRLSAVALRMIWGCSIIFLGTLTLSQIASLAQITAQTATPDGLMTVTLDSPLKYRLANASWGPNGRARPDLTRGYFDFTFGEYGTLGSWDLSYGFLNTGQDDWFMVRTGDNERSVIKDLGPLGWNAKIKLPIVQPLPALKPGEHRKVNISTSTEKRSGGLSRDIRGAPSARDQDIGLPSRDPDNGPTFPPPLESIKVDKQSASKQPKSDPVLAKAVLGHMYLIHILNPRSDFYVLVHVDGLVLRDNCTISWRLISAPGAGPLSITPSAAQTGNSVSPPAPPGLASAPTQKSAAFADASIGTKPPVLISRHSTAANATGKPALKAFGSSLDRLKWDPEKQAAVEIKDSSEKRDAEDEEDVIRVETRLVVSEVLVLDQRGRAVEGLTQNDFIVTEDGQPEEIAHFSLGDDADVGRSIVLIFDYSISMSPYIELSTAAAHKLVSQLGPKDRMAIVTDDVQLLVDFTGDKSQLANALDWLAKKAKFDHFGKSAQFSALLATFREMFDNEDIRPIVIFQTDGDQIGLMQPVDAQLARNPWMRDKVVQFSLNDVNSIVEKSRRATIYTVIPNLQLTGLPPDEQTRRADLMIKNEVLTGYQRSLKNDPNLPPPPPLKNTPQALASYTAHRLKMQQAAEGVADLTGGQTFFLEQPDQAGDIYSRILSDVNRRYVIGYYPTNKATDGKRRKVAIELRNHPDYIVQGRKSYIAAGQP